MTESLTSEAAAPCSRRVFVGEVLAAGTAALAGAALLGGGPAYGAEAQPGQPGQLGSADPEYTSLKQGEYATPCVVSREERRRDVRRVLIVVDYQTDFVSGGVFGEIEPAKAIEDALYARIKEYQDAGDIVIYTMDTHPLDNYADTREGQFNPPHCIPGTPGWEIFGKVGELLTPEKALRVMKGTYGSRDLPFIIQHIKDQGVYIDTIEFAGVSTTCRVLHNALIVYNFFPETFLLFDSKTTAGYSDEATVAQLKQLEGWGFCIRWNDTVH